MEPGHEVAYSRELGECECATSISLRVKMIFIIPNLLLSSVGVIVNNNNHIDVEVLKVISLIFLLILIIHSFLRKPSTLNPEPPTR